MIKSTHTSGPWHVVPDSTCSGAWLSIRPEGDEHGDYEICQTATFATSTKSKIYAEDPHVWKDKREADEIRANARLIAAAPELLQACREALSEMRDYSDKQPARAQILAAIAKAEGK